MSFNDTYRRMFADGVYLTADQRGSNLSRLFEKETIVGKSAVFRRNAETIDMDLNSGGLYSPVVFSELSSDWRYLDLQTYEKAIPVSKQEKDRLGMDPMNNIVTERLGGAIGRKMDEILISALLGSAKTGETGSGSTAFDSAQVIAVNDHTFDVGANGGGAGSGNVGLTIGKLLYARQLVDTYRRRVSMMDGRLYVLLNAFQFAQLLREERFTSQFYSNEKALTGNPYVSFLNMEFVVTEMIPDDTSGYDQVLVIDPSVLKVGMPNEGMFVDIEYRPDIKSRVWQAKAELVMGAVRMDEKLIVNVKCTDA